MVLPPEKAVPDSVTVPGQLVTQPELIGKRVRVIGLEAKPEYNGKLGTVTVWDETRQRAGVLLDSSSRLALKPANLEPLDSASSAPAARIAAILAQPVERGEPSAIDDPPPLLIIVESLNPARGHAIEIGASETIGALKARYAQVFWSARYAQVLWGRAEAAGPAERLAPNMSEREEYELLIRLVHDGAELPDDARLKECGLATGSRVIAMDLRQRKGFAAQIGRQMGRWWPLLLAILLLLLLVGEASGAVTGAAHPVCNRPASSTKMISGRLHTGRRASGVQSSPDHLCTARRPSSRAVRSDPLGPLPARDGLPRPLVRTPSASDDL